MVKLVNKAKMDTATTGTGTITLDAAYPAFQSFAAAGVSDGDTIRYGIEENNNWEIGTGVYTAAGTTLTRSVTESSNAGSPIDLQGNAVVYVTAAVGDFLEPDNNLSDVDDAPTALGNLGLTATAAELNTLDGITATVGDLNKLDGLTATTTELNTLDGLTATTTELNKLDGVTATTTEINYLSGATGNIQNQLDSISVTAGSLTKSFASGETSSISLSSALSPAPVVSVTKEVPQVGIVSKGSWDVATSGANYDRLDSAYDTTLTPYTEGWDVSTASFVQSFDILQQESQVQGVFFKPDGTKMYIIGYASDQVHEYDLSTAWDVSTASLLQEISVAAQELTPSGIFFKPDGTKMYVVGLSGWDVNEYNLSTAWDISTASFLQNFSVFSQETSITGVFFKPDGTKMYIIGYAGDDVNEYNLSTAWDVSTASYSQNFSVSAQEITPEDFFFKPDGTKMYVLGNTGDDVNEYSLSTAWDVSTASYSQNFSVSAQDTDPRGIFFKPDGSKMYVAGFSGNDINEYDITLNNFLALGSGSFASTDVGKTIEGNGGVAVLTATDGSYTEVTAFTDSSTIAAGDWGMYGAVFDATNGLELSGGGFGTWDISQASFLQNFSVSAQESFPTNIFFKPDGTKMYIVGITGDDVNEYDLSTAWDVSTASYLRNFSVASQETNPNGIFFKPDGTKMYIVGAIGRDVNEYNLSTAWNVSTASYSQLFSISAQVSEPQGIFFKPDGTKMYILDQTGSDVYEYNLSTAWDVSTSVYSQNFSLTAPADTNTGFFFRDDGLKMYVVARNLDAVYEYNLSAAWDVSTASYSQSFSVSSEEANAMGIFFKPDGTKMYIVGYSGDDVNEYDLGFISAPTSQYTPSITNTGGQINSAFWLDINGMTTDEAAGDGNVYYAVSTDDRTTWSVIKDADGVRPIVRDNAGTWEYNSSVSLVDNWDISAASFAQSFSVINQENSPRSVFFKPDGTKMYIVGTNIDVVVEYDLSTAWDVSTASFLQNFSLVGNPLASPLSVGIFFKSDGTKMYIEDFGDRAVYEYNISTAWDVSTASYVQNFSVSAQESTPEGLFFKPDGTKMYIVGRTGDDVNEYNLSTAWDVSTASYNQNFSVSAQETNPNGIFFKPDGTKMYVIGSDGDNVNEYNLSTAWDISTASYVQNFSVATQDTAPQSVFFKPDGTKMYIVGAAGSRYVSEYDVGFVDYTTSTTWTSATTNTELYALQEALTEVSINRMDKTQLEAVTDPNHYTLGDTLDLMIGLYLDSASASVPSSDGVSIDYDAESLNKGAILGTDYDYDFPDSTTVRITSNATQNLKIRVV